MAGFGIPDKCNINEKQIFCLNNKKVVKIPIALLMMVTSLNRTYTTVKMIIDHDSGKSCFDGQYRVTKLS